VITLSLLHPIKQIPVQVWTFPNETTIRIGRSTDNQVILYSAVVSRHHVELRRVGSGWEILNLGTNGTYLDGKRITQVPVTDGAVIRLARSGPNIQIRIGEEASRDLPKILEGDQTLSQRPDYPLAATEITDRHLEQGDEVSAPMLPDQPVSPMSRGTIPVPPHLQLYSEALTNIPDPEPEAGIVADAAKPQLLHLPLSPPCTHSRGGELFCVDCGQPLQVLQTIGNYQLLKVLGQGEIGTTYQAWHLGQHLVLKTLNPDWVSTTKAVEALECEAETLRSLNHPRIPHLVDFFLIENRPYLIMEFMPGQSLAQYIHTTGAVSVRQAIAWVLQVCDILSYLHDFTPPVVHRGIKPQSLLYQSKSSDSEAIALVDFGAIKTVALGLTTSPVEGNGYNAPEQLDLNATPTVDLYALAPLLVYLITGKNPIAFYSDQGQGYRLYTDSISTISPELAHILYILSHPESNQRYATATEVSDALNAILMSH